jgi:hypothetical protein
VASLLGVALAVSAVFVAFDIAKSPSVWFGGIAESMWIVRNIDRMATTNPKSV